MNESTPEISSDNPISLIYTLHDTDGAVRYVGITTLTLTQRLDRHKRSAQRGNSYRDRWFRTLEYLPEIRLVEVTYDRSRESYWINVFKEQGCRLTNMTDGGEGTIGHKHSPESIEKMRQSQRERYARAEKRGGWKLSDEVRKRSSDRRRGIIIPVEVREKMSQSAKQKYAEGYIGPFTGKNHSPEHIEKMRQSRTGVSPSEQTRLKISAALQGRKSPKSHEAAESCRRHLIEFRMRLAEHGMTSPMQGKRHSEETKAKMRASAIERERRKRDPHGDVA